MALHQTAWNNRTHPNVYQVFQSIFNTEKLWSSIDRWGIMRGTKNLAIKKSNSDQVSYVRLLTRLAFTHWEFDPPLTLVLGSVDYRRIGLLGQIL
jgi:hypothetical protein